MNIARIGETVFNIIIKKEKIDTHTATRKEKESRTEHTAKKSKVNEFKALGKVP